MTERPSDQDSSAEPRCQTIKRDLVLAISPESSFVTVSRGDVRIEPFEPDAT